MHLGGKIRHKKDSLSAFQRKSNGQTRRDIYLRTRDTISEIDIDIAKDFADNTPDEGDLLFSGAFGQKLRFEY